ncbi:MAG TPA: serine hydrolase domain-containing protein [Chthonomonadaceae bacterium]|nr:serine hydrolase domain-containing protein [Chthonomonadaceae bacterium]
MPARADALAASGLPQGVIAGHDWRRLPAPAARWPGARDHPAIDSAVNAAMQAHGIVGAGICIVADGEIVFASGYGWAAIGTRPFRATTATRCGSLAKPVTALCALLLADRGALDLDAPILPLLATIGITPAPTGDASPDPRIGRITARHLMDHTSGLPAVAAYTAWREERCLIREHGLERTPTGADAARDALGNAPLDSDPGERYQYANANFVLLARVAEAAAGRPFGELLPEAMARFGLAPDEVYVSRNQTEPDDAARGANEATYYQTSTERYVSFLPECQERGRVYGEAYHGYATEVSDGAGGLACTALGLGRLIANLQSASPALSTRALAEIATPPEHCRRRSDFDPAAEAFYSKGFQVGLECGRPVLGHGGMTNHCGGVIGHAAGRQYVAVSNWQAPASPYVDRLLGDALRRALEEQGRD